MLIVHIDPHREDPIYRSRARQRGPGRICFTVLIMACGVWLPFSPLAPVLKLESLPLAYFPWLAAILVAYCVLTQLLKRVYIRRFGKWL